MSDPLKEATPEEIKEIALFAGGVAQEIHALINSRITPYSSREQWLLKSRILNIAFDLHYSFIMKVAKEAETKGSP